MSVVELQDRPGELVEDWHDLVVGEEGEVGVVQGALYCTVLYCTVQVGVVQGAVRISLQYFPLGLQEADSSRTIATYFPPREEGNRVTLYQCADTPQLPVFQVMKERLFPIPAQEVPLLTSYNHSGPHQS